MNLNKGRVSLNFLLRTNKFNPYITDYTCNNNISVGKYGLQARCTDYQFNMAPVILSIQYFSGYYEKAPSVITNLLLENRQEINIRYIMPPFYLAGSVYNENLKYTEIYFQQQIKEILEKKSYQLKPLFGHQGLEFFHILTARIPYFHNIL